MITIVFCHPLEKSFNHRILDAVTKAFTDEGREYDVINLYGENFNPVLDSTELANMGNGRSAEPQALGYAEALQKSEQVIFIFPVWWGSMPAMLKGFFDKTFIKGIVYDTTPEGAIMPCLNIEKTTLVTTSEADSELFGNFFMGYLTPMTLSAVGMNSVKWFNLDHTSKRSEAERKDFIESVLAYVTK
ncbi:MAG: NAD(P)H-dependent oxidoreductase [Firmicutes bacterium]|nr:NAD(P)H-dependent oxidoreductase [Bacillota bacterium]MCM1401808.1 NAD(P)H-dependent oxidoreductase [Bacteroides sp.]MCM1477689.1 NAD(P)H-dependent oxidoreductase [Bacteroides sp.]